MRDFDKKFKNTGRFISVFIGIVFTMIVCYWVAMATIAYKVIDSASQQDWSGGIKPVIESLWCGKPGCMSYSQSN